MNYGQKIDLYKELQEEELVSADVNFGGSPEKLKTEYLDVYKGVYAKVNSTDRFDEDTDLSTTYLGQVDIFTLVSEIHENVDLVIGIKNLFELEGVIDSWDSCVSFLNRSIPFFPKEKVSVKPKEQKLIVLEAPFVEEISGMAIAKMLDVNEQKTFPMKLKFIRNRAMFKVTNGTHETVTFDPKEMLGAIDLRSLGYYKI